MIIIYSNQKDGSTLTKKKSQVSRSTKNNGNVLKKQIYTAQIL